MIRLSQPKRLLILIAGVAGASAIAIPAALGLSGNPSFSQRIPVRIPSSAHTVSFDDHGQANERHGSTSAVATPTPTGPGRSSEPGDGHGTRSASTAASEHKAIRSASTEPGDDNGGANSGGGNSGDDNHGGGNSGGANSGGANSGGANSGGA